MLGIKVFFSCKFVSSCLVRNICVILESESMTQKTVDWDRNRNVTNNILEAIGWTPLVKLSRVTVSVKPEIFGKIEYLNPSGSVKDRIYYRIITEAEKEGTLKKGMKIIEASTGNAGIACTVVGRMLGYDVTIVLPAGMSVERFKILKALGAEVLTTPGAESDVDLCFQKIKELKQANPGKYWEPDQFANPDNVTAHYHGTGPEIWEQMQGKTSISLDG